MAILLLAGGGGAVAPQAGGGPSTVPAQLPGGEPYTPELRARLASELAKRGNRYEPRTAQLRPDGTPRFSNRLLLEPSPYLQQHAHNPVDWYPWGDEAFETARRLGRPVLVSIGYSTCHWCHVMEEESFDDPEIAEVLNRHFVAVKVDREARPDIDAIYLTALRAMNQPGGWPLNVWVTPDREPFFGGTYFPREGRDGRPGFAALLESIHQQYASNPAAASAQAERVADTLRRSLEANVAMASTLPSADPLIGARLDAGRKFDPLRGGQAGAPKFPSSFPLRFLLRYARRTGDEAALDMVSLSLEKMAAGGIYDHLGGGFHRYSVDDGWRVPHFEKMLYDNAWLAVVYLEAWQATGRQDFRSIARETLDYLDREMTAPEGGFYSATDADSVTPEGHSEEGRFFTWTPTEMIQALGPEDAEVMAAYYGVDDAGDLEGRNVLSASKPLERVARNLGMKPNAVREVLAQSRAELKRVRSQRPPPLRDEKRVTAWNGLAISAFARAGFAMKEARYLEVAQRSARFVLDHMRPDGRLARIYFEGRVAGPAFLEDYAFLIQGLIDLYEATGVLSWLEDAVDLQRILDSRYLDVEGGGYFKTSSDGEILLAREKPASDGAIPSGNSVTALNLLRLAELTGRPEYRQQFEFLYSAFEPLLVSNPTALSEMLLAIDYTLDTSKEIVIVGPEKGGDFDGMLAPLRESFVPNRILSVVRAGDHLERSAEVIPLVKGRVPRKGHVTAYLCEHNVCLLPTSDPEVFAGQLAEVVPLQ
ncbi:thioredoxin domain-containing protein [Myxococcota bacterium]|nr:thioredoxin domain-containing protein [Myxococcota bacterium]